MIKNGLLRFSLLGALLIFLMTACSTPRYSHNGSRSSSSKTKKYAKKTRKPYIDKAKSNRSTTNRKASVAKVDKLDLRLNVVASAEKFLGLRYKWGGKTFNGIDCSALIQIFYQFNKKFFPRDTKDQIRFSKKKLKIKNFKRGDIIFYF